MTTLMERPAAVEMPREAAPARQRRWPVLVLLAGTALLYLWNLSASGWGNSFYAAAAQAGAQSWKAWLFGSLDAGNAITVDKPPASMWVMGLSARLFGVNSWSILAPQALMGVASIYLLYLSVKRWFGTGAALFAGAALALTPVAVLMFRFDNPDALLVLLMTAAAYATTRAVEVASARWLALTGVLLGFGFLTKMMQAFLVLPAMALVYLIAAPTGLSRRIRHLLFAGLALVLSAGWYVALVSLWPASSRPFIAGSTNNTLWELAIGYNGLGRILGGTGNGGGGSTSFGGATGIGRLFGTAMGSEISWLLPAALIALIGAPVVRWTAPRTDRARAAMLLWGGWLLATAVTFSYMSGTIHPYYTVALAPAIAAVVAIGGRVLWLAKARWVLAAMITGTAVWSFVLLGRTDWLPALRWAMLVLGLAFGLALLIPLRRLTTVALIAAILSAGAGSAAFGAATATVAHSGSIPSSGPSSGATFPGTRGAAGNSTTGPGGPGGASAPATSSGSSSSSGVSSGAGTSSGMSSAAGGRPGGTGDATSNSDLTALLMASTAKWSAAVSGATSAADLELASGTSVIALGGWNGSDPSPTLAEFQKYATTGQIHYYISGGGGTRTSEIATWVAAHYTAKAVGNTTVYDLTQRKSS